MGGAGILLDKVGANLGQTAVRLPFACLDLDFGVNQVPLAVCRQDVLGHVHEDGFSSLRLANPVVLWWIDEVVHHDELDLAFHLGGSLCQAGIQREKSSRQSHFQAGHDAFLEKTDTDRDERAGGMNNNNLINRHSVAGNCVGFEGMFLFEPKVSNKIRKRVKKR